MDRCSCGEKAAVFLHYARKPLCERHFIGMFERRVKRTIREHRMLRKGDKVAVALSGGKDSCVLLNCLAGFPMPIELVAVTIDEGIEGYRPRTLDIARAECERLGIEHQVFSFEKGAGRTMDWIAREKEDIPCSYCGVLRRHLLNKAAREAGADKLALGHNLDDLAQTVLMNIMRNEPSRLARSDDERFIRRIRPLMKTPEREIALYAMLKGIELHNMDCPYAPFAFRGHVRKMLNETEEKYPGTKYKIVNSSLELEDALKGRLSKKAAECASCGEPCSGERCMFCRMVGSFKG